MNKEIFGFLDGQPVYKYTITDGKITASIISYGAVWHSFIVPDKNKTNRAFEFYKNDRFIHT